MVWLNAVQHEGLGSHFSIDQRHTSMERNESCIASIVPSSSASHYKSHNQYVECRELHCAHTDSVQVEVQPSLHRTLEGKIPGENENWKLMDVVNQNQLDHDSQHGNANPNDIDNFPTVLVKGEGPGRRAGHTATAVNRYIYVFGGSCGSDYLNDFFVLDTDPPPRVAVFEPTPLNLLERNLKCYFNNEEFSDVTFLVEGRRVYCHRLVLSLASDCFKAMFTTGFKESTNCAEIEIPNCSHETFLRMMEYVYTGKVSNIDIFSGSDESICCNNLGKIVELLELADKFFLYHLKQLCERLLQPIVNVDTVNEIKKMSVRTNALQLESVCRQFERNFSTENDQQG